MSQLVYVITAAVALPIAILLFLACLTAGLLPDRGTKRAWKGVYLLATGSESEGPVTPSRPNR
jgi:hypothetical protein